MPSNLILQKVSSTMLFISSAVQWRIATSWTVQGSNPGWGEIFLTRPDRPSSTICTGSHSRAKIKRQVCGANNSPHLALTLRMGWSHKCPPLCTFVARYKENFNCSLLLTLFILYYSSIWWTAVAQCANRKVAGSISDGVIGIFYWHNTSDRSMVLGSNQPLTEMSTRTFPGGKGGWRIRLTTLPPSCAVVM